LSEEAARFTWQSSQSTREEPVMVGYAVREARQSRGPTGSRASDRTRKYGRCGRVTVIQVTTGHLVYPVVGRNSAKSGLGRMGNCHLNRPRKSILMNVGGCPETEPSRSGGETWTASVAS